MEQYTRQNNTHCAICDKPIYRRPFQINKGPTYCSQTCYGKACTILVKCAVCSITFHKGLNKKTCSRSCSNKLRLGSSYNLGRPSKSKVKSRNLLKERLIKLRGTLCERCGYDNTHILNVHHKIRRADGGLDDLDNLELICPNCHAEEHYGK